MLGLAIFTVTRAVARPVIWTMPLPAKSCMPHPRNALLLKAVIQPDELQMQHITTAGFVATSPLSPRCHLVVCRRGDASATVRRPLSRALRHVGSAVLRCHEVPRPNVDALHPAPWKAAATMPSNCPERKLGSHQTKRKRDHTGREPPTANKDPPPYESKEERRRHHEDGGRQMSRAHLRVAFVPASSALFSVA